MESSVVPCKIAQYIFQRCLEGNEILKFKSNRQGLLDVNWCRCTIEGHPKRKIKTTLCAFRILEYST